jgi:hypothetical protein
VPGAAVFLGGFLLMVATGRHVALFGALLAAALGRIASVTSGIRAVEPVPETVPAETAPIGTVPARTVPARAVPAEDTPRTIG